MTKNSMGGAFGFYVLLLFFTNHNTVMAQVAGDDYSWSLKKNTSGIQIYTSKVSGSKYKAVSASMVVESSVESLAALVMDLENCANWAAFCKRAMIVERVSPTETYVYSMNDLPFPARNRDAVMHVVWSRDQSTGQISMRSQAVLGKKEKTKGIIRVKEGIAQWYFMPQEGGKVLVKSLAHINPESDIPAWLTNRLLLGAPYKTMKKMRKIIRSGDYENAQLPF